MVLYNEPRNKQEPTTQQQSEKEREREREREEERTNNQKQSNDNDGRKKQAKKNTIPDDNDPHTTTDQICSV